MTPAVGIPCPRCARALSPRSGNCEACGSPPVVLLEEGEDAAACATHAGRRASAPCVRCGRFACAVCLRIDAANQLVCRSCFAAEVGAPFPWDGRGKQGLLRSFAQSAWRLLVSPAKTVDAAPPEATLWSSLLFAFGCLLPSLGSTLLAQLAIYGADSRNTRARVALELIPIFATLCALGWLLVWPALEWLVLWLVGAQPSYRVQVRAAAMSMAPLSIGFIPYFGCALLPIWCIALRFLTCHSLQRLNLMQLMFAMVGLPACAVAVGLAFRLDLLFW